jgi:hypothetical protein
MFPKRFMINFLGQNSFEQDTLEQKKIYKKLYSQRQQTPNPDAQDPALVPPVKSKTKKNS